MIIINFKALLTYLNKYSYNFPVVEEVHTYQANKNQERQRKLVG